MPSFTDQIRRETKAARKAISEPEKHSLSYLVICRNFLRDHCGWK